MCRILIESVGATNFRCPDLKLLLGLPTCLHGTGWIARLHGDGLYGVQWILIVMNLGVFLVNGYKIYDEFLNSMGDHKKKEKKNPVV